MPAASSIFKDRRFKIAIIAFFILLIATIGLHIWFVNNARQLLIDMVHQKSKGKVRLELSEISVNLFSRKLKVREADLLSTDSTTSPTTYNIKFRKLTIRINSLSELIFRKKLYLDSVKLHDPQITVMQWRPDTTTRRTDSELSVPQEMGKLYNSMLDVLEDVGIKRIMINNASIHLVNKMKAGSPPVTISNIYFDLKRSGKGKKENFVPGEENIELRTTHQDITLPGGRHRLTFQKFRLELLGKHIQMDSCTIRAIPTDSSKSSYTIFFEKLLLAGVDFDAMYRLNLIRADSVYSENPKIDIQLNTIGGRKKERPDPEEIIQELTGDLDLAFVGVTGAGINIDITGRKKLNISNSSKDNFELRGLRINADSAKPVVVRHFNMRVSDFQLRTDDSTSAYTFDSIQFNNNLLVLHNFAVATTLNQQKHHNYRDFRIPYFELSGIDWYELVFQQNMKAQEARMINPVINYVAAAKAPSKKKKKNIFSSLETIGDLVTLNRVNVINGEINMKLGPTTQVRLHNASLSLFSNRLLQSTNNEGLRRAVDRLSFSSGILNVKSTTVKFYDVHSTPTHLVVARRIDVSSPDRSLEGSMNNVVIDNMLLDDLDESITVDGVRWSAASLKINTKAEAGGPQKSSGDLYLMNIHGRNTRLDLRSGPLSAKAFFHTVDMERLTRVGTDPVSISGMKLQGEGLELEKEDIKASARGFQLVGNGSSRLTGLNFRQVKGRDSIFASAPSVTVSMDINELLSKQLRLGSVDIFRPDIRVVKIKKPMQDDPKTTTLTVGGINLQEPSIHITLIKNDSLSVIDIPRSPNSLLAVNGLSVSDGNFDINGLSLKTTSATYQPRAGEMMGVGEGQVEFNASDLHFAKKDGKSSWNGILNSLLLQNPKSFTTGKGKGRMDISRISLGNVKLSSEYMNDMSSLIKYNVSAWLKTGTGTFADSNSTIRWYNAEYSYADRALSLDSFSYHPTVSLDSMLARTPYQKDYITFKSGRILFKDFDLERYNRDSALNASSIHVFRPVITIYRDKQPPFLSGIIKPLPVDMIKKIPMPVSVNMIRLDEGLLSYTEKHPKTRAEGTIQLTHFTAAISNFKNREIAGNDSLLFTLDALLMDSARLSLRVKESYTDSLAGFLMTLRMMPTNLSFLNPVIAPLSNVIFKSGTIDSFHLRAIGRDDLSFGEMNMYYHDLKIRLVKEGDEDKRSFGRNVLSYLANLIVIRKDNDGRMGLVYFERLRDRSFFNYIIKMTFSGMATSVGVKKNKKYRKQYERELRERSLPPIVF